MVDEKEVRAKNSILIIDDNPSQIKALSDILETEDLIPITCQSGGEAIRICESQDVNVAILDPLLPDIDGLELLRKLRQLNPDMKIIISTANASLESAVAAVNEEAFAYVTKVGDAAAEELITHVHRAFHLHLTGYSEQLATEVSKRTKELSHANEELKYEISERKRAEEALSQQEKRIRSLYEISAKPGADIGRQLMDTLQSGTNVLGLNLGLVGEIVGNDLTIEYCYDGSATIVRGMQFDLDKIYCNLTIEADDVVAIDHAGITEFAEHRCYKEYGLESYIGVPLRVNGKVFGTLTFSSPTPREIAFNDADKDYIRLMGKWISSMLERAQAESALRNSEERYRALYENSPTMFFTVDYEGTVLSVNKFGADQLGYSVDELVGNSVLNVFYEEDKSLVREHISLCLDSPSQLFEWESRKVCKDGTVIWVSELAQSVHNNEGNLVVFIICEDITKRKHNEEALKLQSMVLQSMAEGVCVTNSEGEIVFTNPAFNTMFGDDKGEIDNHISRLRLRTAEGEMHISEVIEHHVSKNDTWSGEFKSLGMDGCYFNTNAGITMLEISNAEYWISVHEDINDRKKLEEEQLKNAKLESLGVLAGGIAHDFNNILTVILGNISIAKISVDSKDKLLDRLVEAESASIRAKDLTQQLLTFAKGGSPIKKSVTIEELLRESARFVLSGSNTKLEFNIEQGLWPAEIDEGQINQVINNLVINASQAMPEGGLILVTAENCVVQESDYPQLKKGAYIKVVIKDTGIGIPQEHLQKIFDPYFTTKQKGSGLGLATAYSIIQKHDGRLIVESELGVGTTFSIYLRVSGKGIKPHAQSNDQPLMGDGKVLVMDDEDTVRDIAKEMLHNIGYTVEFAANGVEAILQYQKAVEDGDPFDVVILDLTIPGEMGGKETVKGLLEVDPNVKAVVSSGYANDMLMAEFKNYGFKGYVKKPYQLKELSKVLNRILNS